MVKIYNAFINSIKRDRIKQYRTLRESGISEYKSYKLIKFSHSFWEDLRLAPSRLALSIYLIKKGGAPNKIVSNLEQKLFGFASDNDL